jgi:AraC family transcriptional regulator, regulatory protein of adaptative response / methylated-DNA-[protein]-cysteine methyltransferase
MTHAMNPIQNADESRWASVLARDAHADGAFVYAVRTTGVYCRPSCPSRRPRRESVMFFAEADAAELAGFRECRRCHPRAGVARPAGLDEVRRACVFIQRRAAQPLTLAQIAAHVGTSPFHLQRTFTKLVGISPRAYQDAVRAGRFREGLRGGAPVSGAVYDAGYGSISRVYERRPTGRGMTPAAYRRGGKGMAMTYTIVDSPVGRMMVAGTDKGICSVKLGDRDERLEQDLRREYPEASIIREQSALDGWVRTLLGQLNGSRPHLDLPLDVQATAFQWKVWRYLQSIPAGETRAYSEVAKAIGKPDAVRAVARACATNPVCLVVPCHRVVGKDGSLTGYRWGVKRKKHLLQIESKQ